MLTLFFFGTGLCAGESQQSPNLHFEITGQSHPSGLYHIGDRTILNIRITNPGTSAQMLSGNLQWVLHAGRGKSATPLATTPIRPTMLTSRQIVRIELPETFNTVGRYALLWNKTAIAMRPTIPRPRCIYAPSTSLTGKTSPWIASIPKAFISAHPPDYISSFIRETGIRQYMYNLNWDRPGTDMALPQSHLPLQFKRSGARLIPVWVISPSGTHRSRWISSKALIAQLKPLIGICPAIVVRFSRVPTVAMSHAADNFIPRLHQALHALQSSVPIFATPDVIGAGKGNITLTSLIGGVALPDNDNSLRLCHQLEQSGATLPIMIMPNVSTTPNGLSNHAVPNPGLFLARAATYVPVPAHADNFELHVLGTGKLFSIVHPRLALLAAVFKQPYGSCAIVCGPGASKVAGHQWIAWQNNPPKMIKDAIWHKALADGRRGWERLLALLPPAGTFPHGKLIVVDAEGLMATRNSSGQSVPTPYPGWQEIPLNRHVYFLTYPGSPSDLAAALRTASINDLPAAAVTTASNVGPHDADSLTFLIRNARVGRLLGNVSLWQLEKFPTGDKILPITATVQFGPIHSGDTALVTLPIHHTAGSAATNRFLAVIRWRHWIELTSFSKPPAGPDEIPPHVSSQSIVPRKAQPHAADAAIPPLHGFATSTSKVLPPGDRKVQTVELPYMPTVKTP